LFTKVRADVLQRTDGLQAPSFHSALSQDYCLMGECPKRVHLWQPILAVVIAMGVLWLGWQQYWFGAVVTWGQNYVAEIKIARQTEIFKFKTVTVNAKGKIIRHKQKQTHYKIEYLRNGVTLDMVYIPGGTFMMGSSKTKKWYEENESPQHQVTIKPFFMSKYEVTQAQWQAMMGNNPSYFKGENRPVENVSWNDVVEFNQRLSKKTGKAYRLPSEAEWEYAARAGTTTPFYFGETITTDLVNYDGDYPYASAPKGVYRKETIDVGSFLPNAFGLYDMHGNVYEWCVDPWHDNYQGAPNNGSVWKEGGDEDLFVLRGGSWSNGARWTRSASRSGSSRTNRGRNYGVRLAMVF